MFLEVNHNSFLWQVFLKPYKAIVKLPKSIHVSSRFGILGQISLCLLILILFYWGAIYTKEAKNIPGKFKNFK